MKIRSAKLRDLRVGKRFIVEAGRARPGTASARPTRKVIRIRRYARGHRRSIGTPSPAECRGGRRPLKGRANAAATRLVRKLRDPASTRAYRAHRGARICPSSVSPIGWNNSRKGITPLSSIRGHLVTSQLASCVAGKAVPDGRSVSTTGAPSRWHGSAHRSGSGCSPRRSASALALPARGARETGIGAHGPVTEAYGWFPEWYEDAAGTRLELCVEGPYCMAIDGGAAPASRPAGELPGQLPRRGVLVGGRDARSPTPAAPRCSCSRQEAAFANGPIVAGDQVAFGRIRIRATGLAPGRLVPIHASVRPDRPAGGRQGAARRELHVRRRLHRPAVRRERSRRLGESVVGPDFLQWDTTQSAPPEGYVGNPAVAHRVTGSRFVPAGETEPANYFRIQRIDGPGGAVVRRRRADRLLHAPGQARGARRAGHFAARAAAVRRAGGRHERGPAGRHAAQHRLGRAERSANQRIAGDDAADFWVAGGDVRAAAARSRPGRRARCEVGFEPSARRRAHRAPRASPETGGGTTPAAPRTRSPRRRTASSRRRRDGAPAPAVPAPAAPASRPRRPRPRRRAVDGPRRDRALDPRGGTAPHDPPGPGPGPGASRRGCASSCGSPARRTSCASGSAA